MEYMPAKGTQVALHYQRWHNIPNSSEALYEGRIGTVLGQGQVGVQAVVCFDDGGYKWECQVSPFFLEPATTLAARSLSS